MKSELQIRVVPAIAEVPAAAWDACANPRSAPEVCPYNPFVSHAFLHALEASGSASARTGWQPQHLVAEIGERVVGVVPCYLKSHSRGEYVFDAGWAEAYERAGGSYYPKLQVSVPFTPARGRRLPVAPGAGGGRTRRAVGGPPPAGCAGRCRRPHARGAGERPDRAVAHARGLLGARDLRAGDRMG